MTIPNRIDRLPRNKAGYPVPWFVAWIGGTPDFRVSRPGCIQEAVARKLCWLCGVPFQRREQGAFVIGPMCAVNRVSAEPPSHVACAVYAAVNCPFLTTPNMVRRERHLPDGVVCPAGESIRRNPGVALVWVSRKWSTFRDGNGGTLFDVGEPQAALWYAEGREATRSEVLVAIDSGLPLLAGVATVEGPDAVAALERLHERALAHVPAAAP